eukprot:TRINITY_DN9562_c0_g1_i1.p1 TRINITY_DN9562_c0_g1~~TRINITY_DN9562_c0_g1_i1.p1  ORF type:complete len:571 (+),score=229.26 TRINITY_DN9562_c0_g1_i1:54-1766(+)
MAGYNHLPPPVQKMFRGLTARPTAADVALAECAQVSDTVRLYSMMAAGSSADSVWKELRATLVRRHGEPDPQDGDGEQAAEDPPDADEVLGESVQAARPEEVGVLEGSGRERRRRRRERGEEDDEERRRRRDEDPPSGGDDDEQRRERRRERRRRRDEEASPSGGDDDEQRRERRRERRRRRREAEVEPEEGEEPADEGAAGEAPVEQHASPPPPSRGELDEDAAFMAQLEAEVAAEEAAAQPAEEAASPPAAEVAASQPEPSASPTRPCHGRLDPAQLQVIEAALQDQHSSPSPLRRTRESEAPTCSEPAIVEDPPSAAATPVAATPGDGCLEVEMHVEGGELLEPEAEQTAAPMPSERVLRSHTSGTIGSPRVSRHATDGADEPAADGIELQPASVAEDERDGIFTGVEEDDDGGEDGGDEVDVADLGPLAPAPKPVPPAEAAAAAPAPEPEPAPARTLQRVQRIGVDGTRESDKVVFYTVVVTDVDGATDWVVRQRYSAFAKLREQLGDAFKAGFPPKSILSLSGQAALKRMQALHEWIGGVAAKLVGGGLSAQHHQALAAFLDAES